MAIIVDGYNLLFAANIVAEGPGKYSLEKSRRSVLRAVAALLTEKERRATTVVFDGKDAPPGLEKVGRFADMAVLFSAPGTEADDLIEDLIRTNHAPRRLVVVSSDHRLHRAARRRQATAMDSDVWYQQKLLERRRRNQSQGPPSPAAAGPGDAMTSEEIADWIEEFGEVDIANMQQQIQQPEKSHPGSNPTNEQGKSDSDGQVFNPFPEGYGEDLLE